MDPNTVLLIILTAAVCVLTVQIANLRDGLGSLSDYIKNRGEPSTSYEVKRCGKCGVLLFEGTKCDCKGVLNIG